MHISLVLYFWKHINWILVVQQNILLVFCQLASPFRKQLEDDSVFQVDKMKSFWTFLYPSDSVNIESIEENFFLDRKLFGSQIVLIDVDEAMVIDRIVFFYFHFRNMNDKYVAKLLCKVGCPIIVFWSWHKAKHFDKHVALQFLEILLS